MCVCGFVYIYLWVNSPKQKKKQTKKPKTKQKPKNQNKTNNNPKRSAMNNLFQLWYQGVERQAMVNTAINPQKSFERSGSVKDGLRGKCFPETIEFITNCEKVSRLSWVIQALMIVTVIVTIRK